MKKAVFLDKDGTLINNVPYNVDADLVSMADFAAEALRFLKENDYLLIVVSNQSGIADGFFEENDLEEVNVEIQKQLLQKNVQIDAFYYCPHLPDGALEKYAIECDCRKPKPGLILKAADDFNIDVNISWMVGDILNDTEAGNQAGCKTILIDNGNETEWIIDDKRTPDYKVKDLRQAAEVILKEEKIKGKAYDKLMA